MEQPNILDKIEQPKLKKWLELEDIKNKLVEAVEHKNYDEVADLLCSYVSTAVDLDVEEYNWHDVAVVFNDMQILCVPRVIPILTMKQEIEDVPWEYNGREWYFWVNKLSSKYGWDLEYIANLNFNDGLSLMQEIMVDEQLLKEWEWDLSELTYNYNSTTKKTDHKSYPRPSWMTKSAKVRDRNPEKPVKILKSMIPAGVVISLKDRYEATKHEGNDEAI